MHKTHRYNNHLCSRFLLAYINITQPESEKKIRKLNSRSFIFGKEDNIMQAICL